MLSTSTYYEEYKCLVKFSITIMSRSNLNHFTIKNWWLVYFFLSLKIMKVCTNTPQVMTKIVTNCDKLSFFFCFHQQTWLIISNIKYHFYSQTASVDVIHNNPVILPVWLLAVIIWDNAHTHHHNNRHQHLLSSMFSDGEIQSRKKKKFGGFQCWVFHLSRKSKYI